METNRIFERHREEITSHLYLVFNGAVFGNRLPTDLPIFWSGKLRSSAGRWSPTKQCFELSKKVLDTYPKLRDTLIHEMCHAAVSLLDRDPDCVHGPKWKLWTKKAMKVFPTLDIGVYHTYDINYKYKYECVVCGQSYGRHSKSIDLEFNRCGKCFGKLQEANK